MFVKRYYRPKENIEHVHNLLIYSILLDKAFSSRLKQSPHYKSLVLKDLIFYLDKVHHLDPEFLRVALNFTLWVVRKDNDKYFQ